MIHLKKIIYVSLMIGLIISIVSLGLEYRTYYKIKKTIETTQYHPDSAKIHHMYQKNILNMSLSILALFLISIIIAGMILIKNSTYWWIISVLVSFIGLIEIFLVWGLVYDQGYYYSQEAFTPLITKQEQNDFLKKHEQKSKTPFIAIPTGIYIENFFFSRKDNDVYPGIIVNGIIWQRYAKTIPEDIERGIIIPDANQIHLNKIFHTKNEQEELIGWYFSIPSMFQWFDLSKFPFDYRHVKIRLLHSDFEKNVILVPDLASYESTAPEKLPGLNNSIIIPHWFVHKTFFGIKIQNLGTNFGSDKLNYSQFPQLYFYMMTHRSLWDTAGIYFILLFVVAVILFVALLAFLRHEKLTGLLGFSTMGVLGVCTSLLFVLISSHVDMRNEIAIDGTAYIESIYAALYFMTIFIAFNGIFFALSEKVKLITFKENFIVKLLYWPVLIYSILLMTILKFY